MIPYTRFSLTQIIREAFTKNPLGLSAGPSCNRRKASKGAGCGRNF